MTSQEAINRINAAIDSLREVRDTIGAELTSMPDLKDPEVRRLSVLHDRAANAVAAYHKGQ